MQTFSYAIGFDDAPFQRHQGNVRVVGVVYNGLRLEGVLSGQVRQDGRNSTPVLTELVRRSKFYPSLRLVLLQGIALAGFNVVDIRALSDNLGLPVLVVLRRKPNLPSIEAALRKVRGGQRKWALIQKAGPVEAVAGVYVQRAGLTLEQAERVIRRLAVHSRLPEPLRAAHLIAGGLATGQSRARP
ncbi:hypothetical protein Mlute_00374 [Meiothermus luteus]|jgi:endonuclease V-like protein UPF0215 family|uniref:Uncharacterized protein n=1 Tax=Meiothermus luteus TaxID=2026184 RepID=A0A399EX31_9DEIN|nr:DUF99 family protein [Meiothermus luteus]RIH89167.1 hypothetical protein Mlute_00374 [Meiothermus luteus]RMH56893.1 MAG: DUF99 family protein [Deinococcota bacterium]